MDLTGALINQQAKLARLDRLRHKLLRQANKAPRSQTAFPPRSGAIQQGVIDVLAASPEPMQFIEVHAAVERLLSMPVSKETVKDCLWKGARGEKPRFERVRRGLYRLRA